MDGFDYAIPMSYRVRPTSPFRGASYSNPISVDEFLDRESESEDNNPICVDEFMDSEMEDIPYEESVSSISAATSCFETESAATSCKEIVSNTSVVASSLETESAATDSILEEATQDSFTGNTRNNDDSNEEDSYSYDQMNDIASEAQGGGTNGDYMSKYDTKEDAVTEGTLSSHTHLSSIDSSRGRRNFEPELEAQEWTYEDHAAHENRKLDREKRKKERYKRAERRRKSKLMWFGVFLLLLEVAGASISVMNYQELVECCGRSIFSENETVGERWNRVFYWVGILYLPVIILVEIPTLIIAQETLFLFNPMVGYLLAMQMMYSTDTESAYIIFGLEVVAMLGQSMILVQVHRTPESCIHSILNYTLAGMTVYLLVSLSQQGGYCIVNDRIQSVFSDSTCNTACIDDSSCFQCTADEDNQFSTQCFIRFS